MSINISNPDMENFLDVLSEYAKSIPDPHLIDAAQTLRDKEFREKLTAFSRSIGRLITFNDRDS